MKQSLRAHFSSLHTSERGSVIIMTTFAMLLTIMAVGVAVDMVRGQTLHSRMQSALDAAGLAISTSNTTCSTQACMNTLAQKYFNANFSANYLSSTTISTTGAIPTLTVVQNGNNLTLTANTQQNSTFLKTFGMNTVNVGANTHVEIPMVTLCPVSECIYVTNQFSSTPGVDVFDGTKGTFLKLLPASGFPQGIGVDSTGTVWVLDQRSQTVGVLDKTGAYTAKPTSVPQPMSIAWDHSGNIWMATYAANRVQEYNSDLTVLAGIGPNGSGAGQISSATFLAFDNAGNMWVVNNTLNRVQEYSLVGGNWQYTQTIPAGNEDCSRAGTCQASAANGQFNTPEGIAIASNGDMLIVDAVNKRIERFSSSGVYKSTIKSAAVPFWGPIAIAIDSGGNIFVTDSHVVGRTNNSRVLEFADNGTYVRTFGASNLTGSASYGIAVGYGTTGSGISQPRITQ